MRKQRQESECIYNSLKLSLGCTKHLCSPLHHAVVVDPAIVFARGCAK